MNLNKILILGTGNAQVDFIEFCKKKGYEVHSCSYKCEGRGVSKSDYFKVIDIVNTSEIGAYVVKNNIGLVYSIGSDIAMPSLTEVNELLNLPNFVSSEIAKVCNNKASLRKALNLLPQYNVRAKQINCEEDLKDWDIFPAVIKPADSQGQRGITKMLDRSQLLTSFQKAIAFSRSKAAIIEEYISGLEISINLYVVNGSILLSFISERESFEEFPGGIVKMHKFPITKPLQREKIQAMCKSVLNHLNISNGPAYIQVKIDENGDPKIIEISPRLDGCHMWRLIKELYGVNLLEIILKHLSGKELKEVDFEDKKPLNFSKAELAFFTAPPDQIFNKNHFSIDRDVVYNEWYYHDGEIVSPINSYAEKVGYQIIIQ